MAHLCATTADLPEVALAGRHQRPALDLKSLGAGRRH